MRTYKVEIKLNTEQEHLYKLNTSACRVVYNLYVEHINFCLRSKQKPMNNYAFSKWFNNEYLPSHEDKKWIKDASSKAVRHAIDCCYQGHIRFLKGIGRPSKFKNFRNDTAGYFFVRNSRSYIIKHERHRIKVPCLGWVTLKEKNYLPVTSVITSGTITKRAGRYFISVLTEDEPAYDNLNSSEGVGIDLGIKAFMSTSKNVEFANINKSKKIKKLEKSLRRQQRALSRKFEAKKKDKERTTYKNLEKNKLRVQKLHYRLECTRKGYINKCIDEVIRWKPAYITLEDLNIKGMLRNRHLSKAIRDSLLYYTKEKLLEKATKHNIKVREVDRFYPSSKTCSKCGHAKEDLQLKDRTYVCSECGLEIDRDLNAAINLKNAKEYQILNSTDGLLGINACGLHKDLLVLNSVEHCEENMQDEARKSQLIFDNVLDKKVFSWENIDCKYI